MKPKRDKQGKRDGLVLHTRSDPAPIAAAILKAFPGRSMRVETTYRRVR